MDIRKAFLLLLCGASACPTVYASSAQLIAQSEKVSLAVPVADSHAAAAPAVDRLNAASAIPVKAPAWSVRNALFESRTTTPAIALKADNVPPPVAGCVDISVGSVYSSGTADPGFTDCFEFVTNGATKYVATVANLPTGEEHDIHLVQVNTDGSLTYLDDERDFSQNKIVEAITGAPQRLLLLVDSESNVPGGAAFLFQVLGTTGYDAYEPNDSILHPTQFLSYKQIPANLDSTSDVDYYAIKLDPTQTSNELLFTATTTTQTAELETSPGAWATLASGTTYQYSTAAGATLTTRIYDTSTASTSTPTPYTMRVSDALGEAGVYQLLDTENISHLAPGGENVARTVTVGVEAWDHTGNIPLPPNEHMLVRVYDTNQNASPVLLTTVDGYTNQSGQLLVTLNIGGCQGGGAVDGQFHTGSVPSDNYDITFNPRAYVVASLFANPATSLDTSSPGTSHFVHVCSETYLGRN
jgi:hypothetical protein